MRSGISSLWHLSRRFAGSLRPGPPPADDVEWLAGHLTPGERALFDRMRHPDQRHAVEVGRAVEQTCADVGIDFTSEIAAAAALHDVGKVVSDLRTPGRVAATVFWAIVPTDRAVRWQTDGTAGIRRRLADYRRHPELGESLLRDAGSSGLATTWAADHHRPPDRWRAPSEIAVILHACDND